MLGGVDYLIISVVVSGFIYPFSLIIHHLRCIVHHSIFVIHHSSFYMRHPHMLFTSDKAHNITGRYTGNSDFKAESASSALATGRSDTLDEMFNVKYRVDVSGSEVDLFLLTCVNKGSIRS